MAHGYKKIWRVLVPEILMAAGRYYRILTATQGARLQLVGVQAAVLASNDQVLRLVPNQSSQLALAAVAGGPAAGN